MKKCYVLGLLLYTLASSKELPTFAVVVCSFNNERWCQSNLESIFMQSYSNYHVYYCDDASTDDTVRLVKQYVTEHQLEDKITIIENQSRQFKMYNLYTIIHQYIQDEIIVVEIDGDDYLMGDDVFEYLASLYMNNDIWMTYGGFVAWPFTYSYLEPHPISEATIKNNAFRSFYHQGSIFMALRTFYAGLFKKIKEDDLRNEKGLFFTSASDVLTMIPMFEMAGERFSLIDRDCYCYNTNTGNNDYVHAGFIQSKIYNLVRSKKKYNRIRDYHTLSEYAIHKN